MTETRAPAEAGHAHADQGLLEVRISNENFEFRTVHFGDRKVTGAQISLAADGHPAEEFVVLQQLRSGELETLRPTELTDLAERGVEHFFVIRGDHTQRFVVDGLSMEWPRDTVTGLTIKRLAHKDEGDFELILERENTPDEIIEDDQEVRIGDPGVERFKIRPVKLPIIIFVDGEPYSAPQPRMTPNEIIRKAAEKDPATHYLVQITQDGRTSYQGEGDVPIKLRRGMKFQVISTGPTPVSDPKIRTGVEVFAEGLRALGYQPSTLPQQPNHVLFDYTVESGRHAGRQVRLGFAVPADFPMNPPTGPYVSPEIHTTKPENGPHPTHGVQKDQARVFDNGAGGAWQYWSRPFQDWPRSKRTVAVYMSFIWKLWDLQ